MKGVQCYELFGGIALKNHTFFFFFSICWLCSANISCLSDAFVLRFATRLTHTSYNYTEHNVTFLSTYFFIHCVHMQVYGNSKNILRCAQTINMIKETYENVS